MAAGTGRSLVLAWGTALAGVKEKTVSLGGDPIDITSDDSNGWREVLDEPSQQQVDLSVSGVTKTAAMRTAWFTGARMAEATVTYPDGGVLTGDFYLASYSDSGANDGAITFEAELQSSGVITFTPPTP